MKLTINVQQVTRSRMFISTQPFPHTSSWCSAQLVKHMGQPTPYEDMAANLIVIKGIRAPVHRE
jgi:hypothetical protein